MAQKQNYIYFAMIFIVSISVIAIYRTTNKNWMLFRAGEDKFNKKAFSSAIPLLLDSLSSGSTSQKAMLHLADAYVAVGDFPEAIHWYKIYLVAHPKESGTRLKLAQALEWSGNFEEAEEELKKLEVSREVSIVL